MRSLKDLERYTVCATNGDIGNVVKISMCRPLVGGLCAAILWRVTGIIKMGLRLRNFVLPTPTDPGRITLRLGLSVAKSSELGKVNPALRLLPRRLALLAIRQMAFRSFLHDVNQDFAIWQNKRYLERMAMSAGDGPIGLYRHWARQFYTEKDRS